MEGIKVSTLSIRLIILKSKAKQSKARRTSQLTKAKALFLCPWSDR